MKTRRHQFQITRSDYPFVKQTDTRADALKTVGKMLSERNSDCVVTLSRKTVKSSRRSKKSYYNKDVANYKDITFKVLLMYWPSTYTVQELKDRIAITLEQELAGICNIKIIEQPTELIDREGG